MILTLLYLLILLILSVYTYALIDPNITMFSNKAWELFRNFVVDFGYNNRASSWIVFLILVTLLFIFHLIFIRPKNVKIYNPMKLGLIIGAVMLFSYSFLSHDLLSYMFYGKILTHYHNNPYFHMPAEYYLDPWLRFTQWTGTRYPYGPTFLLISAIPSFLGFGKFFLTFFLFKGIFIFFYLMSVYLLAKLNRHWAIFYATNPLIIIEGLANNHNDFIALSITILGFYLLKKNKNIIARITLLFSSGIKYMTLPLLFLPIKNKKYIVIPLIGTAMVLGYLSFFSEIQPWYFLMLFAFIPYYKKIIYNLNIFFFGLIMSYYPYVRFGGWDKVIGWTTDQKVGAKHQIILTFFVLNIIFLLYKNLIKKKIL
ncbi:MAG: hypothetical protein UR68_C0026G0004 [Candidatus Roizmanbacteria bacterium GW2011_GWA2_35_19]|uniref:DUF2029 domain-containing protein n=2 Tax=Candidatus Roizmaniibacteriota TaxID=1752723 RepID=A0A0G0E934_9BACT|nr:MAG: hypothetical protein UR63_C0009G0021 [Candidatus Roizmanbacteria bacterium GW2011_GWC2_35_12]KKP71835.1 MAG: hypothetical protein UR68_C0026G0004 [Candidatus Roizmanbacteria bacterium GW2011_GWA2_35_19]